MKTTKKLITIAHSVGIIIDKPLLNMLDLHKGDCVEVDIKKINNEN